jgi:hypothetical protein
MQSHEPDPLPDPYPYSFRLSSRPEMGHTRFWMVVLWAGVLLNVEALQFDIAFGWPVSPAWVGLFAVGGVMLCLIAAPFYLVLYLTWVRLMVRAARELRPRERIPSTDAAVGLMLVPVFNLYWKHRLLGRLAAAFGTKGRPSAGRLPLGGLVLHMLSYALFGASLFLGATGIGVVKIVETPTYGRWANVASVLCVLAGCLVLGASSFVLYFAREKLTLDARRTLDRLAAEPEF